MVVVVVVMIIAVMMIVMIAPAVAVPVVVMIPMVVVFETAAIAVPVTCKILAAFMARPHPVGSLIRRPRPVARVPAVMPSIGIPVAIDPHKVGTRAPRNNTKHARRRRLSDIDADGDL